MTSPVDPNQVLMTGENSFIRLSPDQGKTMTHRLSHWRVLWCPAGVGHALFMKSALTDGEVRIYSDNAAVARWLQRTIESILFPEFADTSIPVIAAAFGSAVLERSFRRGTALGGEAGRPVVDECRAGVVGNLGRAARLTLLARLAFRSIEATAFAGL